MSRDLILLALLGGAAYLLLASRESYAFALPTVPDDIRYGDLADGFARDGSIYNNIDPSFYLPGNAMTENYGTDETADLNGDEQTGVTVEPVEDGGYEALPVSAPAQRAGNNLAAFLAVIRAGEAGTHGYYALYGNTRWTGDLRDHPSNQGWKGLPLPIEWCRRLGYKGQCYSNAAGAYQFISTTWNSLKKSLGLPDFSEQSQDIAAVELLRQRGALPYVNSGAFNIALQMASPEWASLPGSTAGQGGISVAEAQRVYTAAGGNINTGAMV